MSAREAILAGLRRNLKRAPGDEAAVEKRLRERPRGSVPSRGQLPPPARLELFIAQAQAVAASVTRLGDWSAVPQAVQDYLRQQNLPPSLRLAPSANLRNLPWAEKAPLLTLQVGRADPADTASLTGAFAGIAETGTLMLLSGSEHPSTLNFLPETHLVALPERAVVGSYEEAWESLRARYGAGELPRTVNLVTGPSRTGDIEQKIQLGAHGPRRLHILLIAAG
jgi:L-lactate dehydrogenase complex protein LldG